MKKTIYSSLALGAVLALASCASDEPLGNNQNDGSLSFTVTLPGQNTRFAEGTTVDRLYYSVFDTEGHLVLQNNEDWPAGSLTTTVTLQLVANQSYDIVFFADNSEAEGKGYTYDAETAQFSVTYGQEMVINATYTINGKAGAATVNTLNLASTPVRQNYQTNIYGSLLTTQNAFTVTIDPAFEGMIPVLMWDGSVSDPIIDEIAKTVTVTSPGQLAGFASKVNDGNQFEGYTVTLENDMDLANIFWTPIGSILGASGGQSTTFKGVFDGKGHTISNLNVNVTGEDAPAGFFGQASYYAEVKNLNINGFNVTGNHYASALVGYSWTGAKISNCNVSNGEIKLVPNASGSDFDNGDKAGSIAGYSNATITDCHASNVKITGFRDLGALVGYNWGPISACSANNITITHSDENSYGNYAPYHIGLLTGFNGTNNYDMGIVSSDCTASNVTLNGMPSGNYVYIKNKQDLINFASAVNSKTETYEGKKVVLLADIDMGGSLWTPVGVMTKEDLGTGTGKVQGARFSGSFEGNGHAVSNFVVNQTGEAAVAGFFGRVTGNVTISNLKVLNANISSDHYAGGIVAYIYNNNVAATASVLACAVANSTITSRAIQLANGEYDNGDKVGGICGYVNVHTANAKAIFNNCRVSDCTLQAYRDLGGLIGYVANSSGSISGSTNAVMNLKLIQDFAHNYKNLTAGARVGNVLGYHESTSEPNLMAGSSRNFGNTTTTINQ